MIVLASTFYRRLHKAITRKDYHRFCEVLSDWCTWRKLKYSDGLELLILARKKGVVWAPPAILLVSAVTPQDIIDRFDAILI
jgi:hypothetical protein